jgi:hypothetical protein
VTPIGHNELERVWQRIDEIFEQTITDLVAACAQPSISAQGIGMAEMAAAVTERFRALGAEVSTHRYDGGYPAGLPRGPCYSTTTTMSNHQIRSINGSHRRSNPPFATDASSPAAPPTTRER